MNIKNLPDEERKAYFRENKRLSRAKLKGQLTKEEVSLRNREQYLKNKKRYKDKAAVWNKKHGEYMRAQAVWHRLKKLYPETLESTTISVEEMEAWFIEKREAGCVYCGSKDKYCMDHITPLISGGEHSWANIQLLCSRCNSWKGPGSEQELKERIRQMYSRMCV